MRKYITFATLILTSTWASANVISTAFSAPYVSAFLFPAVLLAVLVVEGAIYKYVNISLYMQRIAFLVVTANLVS